MTWRRVFIPTQVSPEPVRLGSTKNCPGSAPGSAQSFLGPSPEKQSSACDEVGQAIFDGIGRHYLPVYWGELEGTCPSIFCKCLSAAYGAIDVAGRSLFRLARVEMTWLLCRAIRSELQIIRQRYYQIRRSREELLCSYMDNIVCATESSGNRSESDLYPNQNQGKLLKSSVEVARAVQ